MIHNVILGCRCDTKPPFCTSVNEDHNIIRAVVLDHPDDQSIKVKVVENLNNEITEDTIVILGQDGVNCGELLWQLNLDDTYILALEESDASDYNHYLNGCGTFFLKQEDGMVTGQITDELTSQSYQDFKDNIFDCVDFDLTLFPNPVSNTFKIKANVLLEASIEIFKANGQLILQTPKEENYSFIINTENFAKGVYFIRVITSTNGIKTRRFVRM